MCKTSLHFYDLFLASCYWGIMCEFTVKMCAPTVNYKRLIYGTVFEKLAFECVKCFSCAATNLHQQNLCMTSGI